MKLFTKSALALVIGLASTQSFAGSESGIYIGGSIGRASLDTKDTDYDLSEEASSYKVLVGYNFGLLPFLDLAVEADYRSYGEFENNVAKSELTSIDAYGLVGMNFGLAGVFVKYGYANTDVDSVIGDQDYNESDTSPSYGIGAKASLLDFTFRGEYEYFDLQDTDDLSMVSVGVTYTF
ncbi:porin family protein [Teredinibacter turnerae]|uniref:porin family protein n=1 Tax=Teredinibacter turnerae TaxID=2426 RepID=UPI0030D26D8F